MDGADHCEGVGIEDHFDQCVARSLRFEIDRCVEGEQFSLIENRQAITKLIGFLHIVRGHDDRASLAVQMAMIVGIAEGYRRKRGLMRALHQYAQTHPDSAFRRQARKMNREMMNGVVALLLIHRNEIEHPNPEMAIGFGLLAVAAVLKHVLLEEERPDWLRMPEDLDEELVRLFFSYLGIKEPKR